jgi:heme exporter protein A
MRLIAEALSCQRSGRPVFAGISFAVEAGGALLLTGRNGAGKSSLLLILAGLLEKEAGRLQLEGGDAERSLGEQAHYVGHRDALKQALTPLETLAFWQGMLGSPATPALEALDRLGLSHAAELPCAYLSAGQRRRLALARLLVSRRPLWLLDEPTSALDAGSQRLFERIVADHLRAGGIAAAATHVPLAFPGAETLRIGGEA